MFTVIHVHNENIDYFCTHIHILLLVLLHEIYGLVTVDEVLHALFASRTLKI